MAKDTHTSPLATAYAKSVLELATERKIEVGIGTELEEISRLIAENPDLQTFLASPAIGEAERGKVLQDAFGGRVSELVLNTILVMNRKGRLALLRQVGEAYAELLQKQQGIVEADVIVAEKLSPDQLEQVRQKVSAALKREVILHQYIDPEVIGGLVLRIEDRLLDASVRAQLRAVRRQLLAAKPR
jgi:F-type H+-transporting ATPase subunit delta